MRRIDRKWIDLALGHQSALTLQARLEQDFGRALQIARRRLFRRELTGWQKKRRIFFTLVALLPLPLIALCLTTIYFREVSCVLAWWLATVLLALLAMAAAGMDYIRQMVSGRPVPRQERRDAVLVEQWWRDLAPPPAPENRKVRRPDPDFAALLDRQLGDDWLAVTDLFPPEADSPASNLLLLGPASMWFFEVRPWQGFILRQDDEWKQGLKNRRETTSLPPPDKAWTTRRESILGALRTRAAHLAALVEPMQGGVVFTHPKVKLEKEYIEGNTAAYGPANAWAARLRASPQEVRLTREMQLEILDILAPLGSGEGERKIAYASARQQAEDIHASLVSQLKEEVAKMVK